MAEMIEITIRIMIDGDGNHATLNDDDDDHEQFESVTGEAPAHPTRIIAVNLRVPTPEVITLSATVPAEAIPATPVVMTIAG